MNKKPYTAPALSHFGSVAALTRAAWSSNADTPGGSDGTAYSPA